MVTNDSCIEHPFNLHAGHYELTWAAIVIRTQLQVWSDAKAGPPAWRTQAGAHQGAGSQGGKSKRLNWPGMSRDAKIMLCSFHWRGPVRL